MNIRKFCAPSVEAALAAVRRELGPEAVILSTREVPFAVGDGRFEVTAARDTTSSRPRGGTATVARVAGPREMHFPPPNPRSQASARPAPRPEAAPAASPVDQTQTLLERTLIRREIDPTLARELARRMRGSQGGGPRQALESLLTAAGLVARDTLSLKGVTLLVGGTGVGKTTTLAKLAARAAATGPAPALLTCDTWRVAAVEQLTVFAELIGSPLRVAYTPEEMAETAAAFHAEGRPVLVDTPGRSPRDARGIADLVRFADALPEHRTHLVVPATIKGGDVTALLEAFLPFRPDRLLVTKLDETTTGGPVLSLLVKARTPASYVTFGQNVPDDLAPARPRGLAAFILEGETHVASERQSA